MDKKGWNAAIQQRLAYNKSCQFMDQGRVNQLVNVMALDIIKLEEEKGNDFSTNLWTKVARQLAMKDFEKYGKKFRWEGIAVWRRMFRSEIKLLKRHEEVVDERVN